MTTLTDIQLFSPTKCPTLWSNTQLFLRYFSVSSKVFYPVAYIMNGIQHLTTPTCLKFCLGIMLFIWPQLLKIWPQLSPVWPQLLSFGERDGDNFTARANPGFTLEINSQDLFVKRAKNWRRLITFHFIFYWDHVIKDDNAYIFKKNYYGNTSSNKSGSILTEICIFNSYSILIYN